jgi:hypothetical protein
MLVFARLGRRHDGTALRTEEIHAARVTVLSVASTTRASRWRMCKTLSSRANDDNAPMFPGAGVSDPASTRTYAQFGPRRTLGRGLAWAALALVVLTLFPSLSSVITSADRTLYFKLPIEGARFHWAFLDPKAFLSGELTLRILNEDRDQTLVVFRNGRIHDGWKMIGEAQPDGSFYFGFATTDRVRTKADDSLIVTLKATKDLLGRGPFSEGVLSAGSWQMSGTYSSIYGGRWNPIDFVVLHGDPPVAYMECWVGVWPITITKREGWNGSPSQEESSTVRKLIKERGTNGRLCGSHI